MNIPISHCIPHRRTDAFTLVELLLVLAILALLAGIIYPNLSKRMIGARITTATTQIAALRTALQTFEVDNGFLPKGQNGLQDLLKAPRDSKNWHGPYAETIPLDPWGHPYVYLCPGKHRPASFDLSSAGPDGQHGNSDDITNWEQPR